MYASENGHIDCVQYLISAGANVSQADNVSKKIANIFYLLPTRTLCAIGWYNSSYIRFYWWPFRMYEVFDQCRS